MFALIGYFLLAIVISFCCSVLEAALLSVTPPFMESFSKKNPKSGKILKYLKEHIDNAIGAILVVNTFANTVGAAGVGAQAVEIFGEKWQGFVAFFMTMCILYISEILPKTIGATYWKKLMIPMAYSVFALYCLTFPFVYISRIITHAFKGRDGNAMSRDEVLAVMDLGEKSGSINELEGDILEHLILQKTLRLKDVMIKKPQVFTLDESLSINEALKIPEFKRYSRIPLISQAGITQMVFKRNLLIAHANGKGTESLKSHAHTMERVSSDMGILDTLERFIAEKEHLFLVTSDEQVVGIIALEDVINAALGVGNLTKPKDAR